MSLVKRLKTSDLTEGEVSKAVPDMLLAGDPTYTTWNQDEGRDGSINTGVWQMTPGMHKSIKSEKYELCVLLEGVVEITENGGELQVFRAGDAFVLKPGFVGVWKTIETVRKIYLIVD